MRKRITFRIITDTALLDLLQSIRNQVHKSFAKTVVYAYLPVGVLSSVTQLPVQASNLFTPQKSVEASILPITGGGPEAKDQASVVGEQFPDNIQRPFTGGMVTTKFSYWHPGIDLAIANGTEIKPVMKGKVVEAGYSYFGYGMTLVVDHGHGMQSRYAHLSAMYAKTGDEVNTQTLIGRVGSTGRSTGPHLHLEITVDGSTVDPNGMLPADANEKPTQIAFAK